MNAPDPNRLECCKNSDLLAPIHVHQPPSHLDNDLQNWYTVNLEMVW